MNELKPYWRDAMSHSILTPERPSVDATDQPHGGPRIEMTVSAAKPRLLLLITEDFYLWSHRLHLACAARDAGMDVFVVTRIREYEKQLKDEGFTLVPIPFLRRGRQPLQELYGVLKLAALYRRLKPDIVHHVAMKPILYGSWAARLAGVPAVVNAVAGLGYGFIAEGWRAGLLRAGLRTGLRSALTLPNSKAIFQNRDDFERMVSEKVVRRDQVVMIRGAGVDLSQYAPVPEETSEIPMVVYGGRMLWHKGIREFIDAARIIRQGGMRARFVLVGKTDPDNPDSLSEEQLLAFQDEGVVEWWGHRDDMPGILARAHVVALPSYTEGLPKILLEAGACARPIVACSNAGCREIVRDGENGFLVPPKDAGALAAAIARLLRDAPLRERMGRRGREIVMEEFSVERVARETITIYDNLLRKAGRPSLGVNRTQGAAASAPPLVPGMMKRGVDILGALGGLLFLSPLFAIVAVLIRMDSPGPVFFRQERIGRRFRAFEIYKFRTMVRDAPLKGGTVTTTDDPRITRFGAILRRTKIDELPQLFNVLKGDMSLVGPLRPEVRHYVDMFRQQYESILTMRPGVTDLASLKRPDEQEFLAKFENPEAEYVQHLLPEKLELGKEYLRRSSLIFDLSLIAKTLLVLIVGKRGGRTNG